MSRDLSVVSKPELGVCLVAVLTTAALIAFPTTSSAAIVFGPRTVFPLCPGESREGISPIRPLMDKNGLARCGFASLC